MNKFTKFLCYLIGWNPKILTECGEASHKMLKRYGAALMILSIIWGGIGFTFAGSYAGVENIIGKIAFALVFVTIIICIERFIILAVGKNNMMTTSRVIIAFLMAVLGSTIADQIIFANDIEVKRQEQLSEKVEKETKIRLADNKENIAKQNAIIDSLAAENLVMYDDIQKRPYIKRLSSSTTEKKVGVDSLGQPVMKKIRSYGMQQEPNPKIKRVETNNASIKDAQERIEGYQLLTRTTKDKVRQEFSEQKAGFMEELILLVDVVSSSWVTMAFYIILFVFLLSLECLVILSKSKDNKCDYELIVEHQLLVAKTRLERSREQLTKELNS